VKVSNSRRNLDGAAEAPPPPPNLDSYSACNTCRGYGDDYSPWLVDAPVGELVRVRGGAVTDQGILAA